MKKIFFILAILCFACFTTVSLSSFQTTPPPTTPADDEADDDGLVNHCYTIETYECGGDGFAYGVSCTFTGKYGSPTSCTSIGCGIFSLPSTRKCVKKKPN